jgi:hypothetical protein
MEFNVVFDAKGYSTFKFKIALYAIGVFASNSFNIMSNNFAKRTHSKLGCWLRSPLRLSKNSRIRISEGNKQKIDEYCEATSWSLTGLNRRSKKIGN